MWFTPTSIFSGEWIGRERDEEHGGHGAESAAVWRRRPQAWAKMAVGQGQKEGDKTWDEGDHEKPEGGPGFSLEPRTGPLCPVGRGHLHVGCQPGSDITAMLREVSQYWLRAIGAF